MEIKVESKVRKRTYFVGHTAVTTPIMYRSVVISTSFMMKEEEYFYTYKQK